MKIIKLEDIVINLPIYQKAEIDFCSNNKKISEEGKKALEILFHTKKVNLKCLSCGKDYPFDVSFNVNKHIYKSDIYSFINVIGNTTNCNIENSSLIYFESLCPKKDEGIIEYKFVCNMDSQHYYKMYLHYFLENNTLTIVKIGQDPTTRDLKDSYSKEYKKVLDKYDAFDDYRRFEQSQERGLLAGSCTYLRRVFEKMVLHMLEELKESGADVSDAKHFDEKIKLVKSSFDPEIKSVLEESYDLLSKGIHELSDEQIDEFDELMQEVINVQLEFEKAKMVRKQKLEALRTNIHKEHSKA